MTMIQEIAIPGYPNYTVTRQGKVFHLGQPKSLICKPGQAPKLRIQVSGIAREWGMALLLAKLFIPNPGDAKKVVFKDGNPGNLHADNIMWVSNDAYVRQNLFRGMALLPKDKAGHKATTKKRRIKKQCPQTSSRQQSQRDAVAIPVPGYNGYFITACGKLYHEHRLLKLHKEHGGRSGRYRVKDISGKTKRISLIKLLGISFIANPLQYPKIIFKDRNASNYALDNIQWVSYSAFLRFSSHIIEDAVLLDLPEDTASVAPPWTDPERVPIEDFPGYYVSPAGIVYKGHKVVKPKCCKRSPLMRFSIRQEGVTLFRYAGLPTLVASYFVANPDRYRHVIFKDGNNQHCAAANLAWVDGQTFAWYCLRGKTRPKIVHSREYALQHCKDEWLCMYYKTGDEAWLHECWKQMEKKICARDWNRHRGELYIYFLDRAKRFSLLGNPAGLMVCHLKGLRANEWKEISPNLPFSKLRSTDESLRTVVLD